MNYPMRSVSLHVAVNMTSTPPLKMKLPQFCDGFFIYIPISSPEDYYKYRDIAKEISGLDMLLDNLPLNRTSSVLDLKSHYDPEFNNCTFGEGPRDWMLKSLRPGDYLFFISSIQPLEIPSLKEFTERPRSFKDELWRLVRYDHKWFYGIIGHFKIKRVYEIREPVEVEPEDISTNAHTLRGDLKEGGIVIAKGANHPVSRLYKNTIPISLRDRCLAELRSIFYKHKIKRNQAKWFENIIDEYGTKQLLEYVKHFELATE